MAPALNDLGDLVDKLSLDALGDGGAEWVGELVQRLVNESGLDAHVVLGVGGGRDSWDVAVMAGTLTVALIDVVAHVQRALDRLDQVDAKANRRWRRETREQSHGQPRPWIGVAVIGQIDEPNEVDAQLDELTRCRTLDAAFSGSQLIRTTAGSLGIQPFAASLLGRFVYVRAVLKDSTASDAAGGY